MEISLWYFVVIRKDGNSIIKTAHVRQNYVAQNGTGKLGQSALE